MKEELEHIKSMQVLMQSFVDSLANYYKEYNREVVLAGMIVKKSLDILDTATYCLKNHIISVQISLIRLLCDNCLAIEAALLIGVKTFVDMTLDNQHVSSIMVDETQNMSDGYLKRIVAKSYPGFDKLYSFACEGVHFSKQALASSFTNVDGTIKMKLNVGNKELENELIANNDSMLTLCKVIIDMLKNACYEKVKTVKRKKTMA